MNLRTPIPQLRCISQATARLEGFTEITTPVCPRTEPAIFGNLQKQLAAVGGVWIEYKAGKYAVGRKTRDLLPIETLVTDHARRERVTVEAQEDFRANITPPSSPPFDEIDFAVADAETSLNRRSERNINSVLQILDEIAVEELRSQNYEGRGAE